MLTIVKGLLKWPLLIFLLVYHISKVRMVRLWFSLNEWLLLWKPRDSNRIARCLYCVHIIIVWLQFLRWFLIGWIPWALRVNWLLWSVWLLSLISLIYIGFQLALVLLIIFLLFSIWAVHFLVSTWFGSILLLKFWQSQWLWWAYFSMIKLIFSMFFILVIITGILLVKCLGLIFVYLICRCVATLLLLCLHLFDGSQWRPRWALNIMLIFNRFIWFLLSVPTYVTNPISRFIWLIGFSF